MMLRLTGCGVVFYVLWQMTCRLGLQRPSQLCARITRRTRTPSWQKEPLSESHASACPPHISFEKDFPKVSFLMSLFDVPPKTQLLNHDRGCWQMLYTLDSFFYGCYPLLIEVIWLHDLWSVAMGDDRPWCHCRVSDRVISVLNVLCSRLIMTWHKPSTNNENCMSCIK